jgi:hypothetical protein
MNIVFDDRIVHRAEYRAALVPLMPEGLSPMVLDPNKGLDGTPNDNESYVFITELPNDILGYHGKFFEEHREAPKWFFILVNRNDHGVSLIEGAVLKYGLNGSIVYHAPDLTAFVKAVTSIDAEIKPIRGKVLLYSKHKSKGVQELSALLAEQGTPVETLVSDPLSTQGPPETDASILLLCGETVSDFKDLPLPKYLEPLFVITQAEKNIQQYLRQASLIDALAYGFTMTKERVKERLFVTSTAAFKIKKEKTYNPNAIAPDFVIWDAFGLPVPRKAWTEPFVEAFMESNFADNDRLVSKLK